jgi:hypothetical protein
MRYFMYILDAKVPVAVVGTVLLARSVLVAQVLWEPPSLGVGEVAPRATVRREMVRAVQVADRRVVLEETLLDDAAAHFGVTTGHSGDASESLDWACLTGADRAGTWILWLMSGEIDGDRVGGFQLRRLVVGERADSRCGVIRRQVVPVTIPTPLRLGLSRRELSTALGRPSSASGDLVQYWHKNEERRAIRGADPEPYTSSNGVAVLFHEGVARAIQVWKSTGS